jgi:hypothetical protein
MGKQFIVAQARGHRGACSFVKVCFERRDDDNTLARVIEQVLFRYRIVPTHKVTVRQMSVTAYVRAQQGVELRISLLKMKAPHAGAHGPMERPSNAQYLATRYWWWVVVHDVKFRPAPTSAPKPKPRLPPIYCYNCGAEATHRCGGCHRHTCIACNCDCREPERQAVSTPSM